MKEINLKLSVNETNMVLDALGRMPFIDVYKIIEKIHLQAGEQQPTQKEIKSSNKRQH